MRLNGANIERPNGANNNFAQNGRVAPNNGLQNGRVVAPSNGLQNGRVVAPNNFVQSGRVAAPNAARIGEPVQPVPGRMNFPK